MESTYNEGCLRAKEESRRFGAKALLSFVIWEENHRRDIVELLKSEVLVNEGCHRRRPNPRRGSLERGSTAIGEPKAKTEPMYPCVRALSVSVPERVAVGAQQPGSSY